MKCYGPYNQHSIQNRQFDFVQGGDDTGDGSELQNVNFFTQSKNSKQILPQEERKNRDKFGA